MHCGIPRVFVTCMGCHTSTPVAFWASHHNYHIRSPKIHRYDSLCRMHAHNTRRWRCAGETRGGDRDDAPRNRDTIQREKTATINLPDDALWAAKKICSVFHVFCPVLNVVNRLSFGRHPTDRRTAGRPDGREICLDGTARKFCSSHKGHLWLVLNEAWR